MLAASRKTNMDTRREPQVFSMIYLVLAAKVHVSNPGGRSRTGKSSIQTGSRGAASGNNTRVKLVESGASRRKRILNDRGTRTDFHAHVQYRHCHGEVEVAANAICCVQCVLIHGKIDIIRRLNVIGNETTVSGEPSLHSILVRARRSSLDRLML